MLRSFKFVHDRVLLSRNFFTKNVVEVTDEVKFALDNRKPIVALESTIITHGMPFPDNVNCALEVESLVRQQGAIPATVAIMNGKIKVGLSNSEITTLGDTKLSKPIKTSRRDLAYVLSNKCNGGTTVAGTLIAASKVGISIFATGGIGGVHRDAGKTFDISADLIELGRCNVAVISSGVKSILDIPKTLEFLETQGVFVATFGESRDFPAFYSRTSGIKAPYCVKKYESAAEIIKINRDLQLSTGLLFAVPIPEEHAIDNAIIEQVINEALKTMDKHIIGKHVTPYLLETISKITSGQSLKSNIALIKNNAKVAGKIAVALSQLESCEKPRSDCKDRIKSQPMIIGGSILDCSANLKTSHIEQCPHVTCDSDQGNSVRVPQFGAGLPNQGRLYISVLFNLKHEISLSEWHVTRNFVKYEEIKPEEKFLKILDGTPVG